MGALLQEYIDDGTVDHQLVTGDLDKSLRWDRDRALFGLPPKTTGTADMTDADHAPVRIDLHVSIEEKDEPKRAVPGGTPNVARGGS